MKVIDRRDGNGVGGLEIGLSHLNLILSFKSFSIPVLPVLFKKLNVGWFFFLNLYFNICFKIFITLKLIYFKKNKILQNF